MRPGYIAEVDEAARPVALPEEDDALLALAGIDDLPPASQGLFRDDGWLRRVSGEQVLLFGGGRALLLEVAHPMVAAGVARFSNFRTDPFGRLRRTLDAMTAITFKDRGTAVAAARGVERAHRHVHGTLAHGTRRFPAGTPYSGRDPGPVRWVWATLVDTALVVHAHFVQELPDDVLAGYYAEQKVMARLLGVPPAMVPPDYPAFRRYFDGVLHDGTLEVTPEGREIGEVVLDPPGGGADARLLRGITAALLPAHLRAPFGLDWDDARAARFAALRDNVRRLRRARSDAA